MLITRLAKILISLSLALFCLLVAYDNITDPHSNYEFVQHVADAERLRRRLQSGQGLRHCWRTSRLPPVVFCVHGDRRRMVRHVAVEGLERATILLPLLFDGARHPHLPQHAGWRAE